MERKSYQATLKSFDTENLIVECIISTETKDRQGDVMIAAGMVVRGRPVVLFGHGRGTPGQEPIAKPLKIEKTVHNGVPAIAARVQFFPDDVGRRLFEKLKEDYISGWSVGFTIIKSEPIDGGRGRRISKWELLEFSLVGIPAQPEAQTLAFKILPDNEEEKCEGTCSSAVRCDGHSAAKEIPRLRFQFVSSSPPKSDPNIVAAVAAKVVGEELQRQVDQLLGKVN